MYSRSDISTIAPLKFTCTGPEGKITVDKVRDLWYYLASENVIFRNGVWYKKK